MSMSAKDSEIITQAYTAAGGEWPATATDLAAFAVNQGYWQPGRGDAIKQCAEQLTHAMRLVMHTDPQGRKVRTKHVVGKELRNGVLAGLWDDVRTMSRQHMALAVQTRRNGIVHDCRRLKTDVDSYNENVNIGKPILLSLNFEFDVEEMGPLVDTTFDEEEIEETEEPCLKLMAR